MKMLSMTDLIVYVIFGLMMVSILFIIINFIIQTRKSDEMYEEAIRKIYNGEYKQ
jgi:hypothetical protein